MTWRVVRTSRNTGKVLKVIASGLTTHREAELWLEGFKRNPARPDFSLAVTHKIQKEEEG